MSRFAVSGDALPLFCTSACTQTLQQTCNAHLIWKDSAFKPNDQMGVSLVRSQASSETLSALRPRF
jgi:hypothetical protein